MRCVGALGCGLNVQRVRLARSLRAPPRNWTLLDALRRRPPMNADALRWRPRLRAQRTESTPRPQPSGAASQLDPSRRPAPIAGQTRTHLLRWRSTQPSSRAQLRPLNSNCGPHAQRRGSTPRVRIYSALVSRPQAAVQLEGRGAASHLDLFEQPASFSAVCSLVSGPA